MLRKFAYNKIFRTTGMLFLLLFLLMFPVSKKYSLKNYKTTKAVSLMPKKAVYLIDKDGYVARYMLEINANTDEEYAKKLMELLVTGGKYESKLPNGFKGILPTDTKVLDVKIDKSDIYVNFSSDVLELSKANYEKAISAIIYNLTSIKNIKNVYIKVDGKLLSNIPNLNLNITQPFTRKSGINNVFDINDYKDSNKVTIYYINKNDNNNSYYFVPVTKLTNDKREKIKIIIDELTSSRIYETNLMSFLNYNTKLLDYTIEDNKLILNFNNYLLDDENSMTVLEEVIYSISLSVKDNYSVDCIVFNVNGKEITKSMLKNIE